MDKDTEKASLRHEKKRKKNKRLFNLYSVSLLLRAPRQIHTHTPRGAETHAAREKRERVRDLVDSGAKKRREQR